MSVVVVEYVGYAGRYRGWEGKEGVVEEDYGEGEV